MGEGGRMGKSGVRNWEELQGFTNSQHRRWGCELIALYSRRDRPAVRLAQLHTFRLQRDTPLATPLASISMLSATEITEHQRLPCVCAATEPGMALWSFTHAVHCIKEAFVSSAVMRPTACGSSLSFTVVEPVDAISLFQQ